MAGIAEIEVVSGALSGADADRAREANVAATTVDGVEALSEQHRNAISAADVVHLLIDGGYANVLPAREGESPMAEAVIHPDYRGAGRGRALVAAALDAAAALGDAPAVWAHGDLPAAQRVAEILQLRRDRELLQLRRSLIDPLPALPVRDDLSLRTYTDADKAELLRVNNAAFDWHPEQGGWTTAQIDERTNSDWFDPAGLFLAFDPAEPDRLLAFHWTKVAKPGLGEVYVVGVDPAAQGRGLGSFVTLAGLHYLAARELDEVELYVEGDNGAALNTYGRLGFRRYRADIAYRRA